MWLSKISTKVLITALVVILSGILFVVEIITTQQFRHLSQEVSERIMSRFIEVTSTEEMVEIGEILDSLGVEIQSDRDLRKIVKSYIKTGENKAGLADYLNESFNRRYQTFGLIDIQKIRAFDTRFNYLASSTQGVQSFSKSLNPEFLKVVEGRKGNEKLKVAKYVWSSNGIPSYSILVPVGGLRVIGYVEIVVDPIHNIKNIESKIDSPVEILDGNGDVRYRAESFPTDLSNYVMSKFSLDTSDGKPLITIEGAFNNEYLISRSEYLRNVTFAGFLGIVVLFMFFSIAFLNKLLFKPIHEIVEHMKQVSNGDLTVSAKEEGIYEVSTLNKGLIKLISSFRENVSNIKENSVGLYESANKVCQDADNTKRSITIQQQKTESVVSAMGQMDSSINEVAQSSAAAAKEAKVSQQKTSEGKQSVTSVIHTIEQLSEQILSSEKVITKLSEQTNSINSILDDITSISEQTNLLALNAAIEAARAGDAGRGFAVVADEVRSLATHSQESANNIRKMISILQGNAEEAVESMAVSQTTAKQAVDDVASAGETINELADFMETLSDINIRVAAEAENQIVVSNRINKDIISIRDVGQDNTKVADHTFKGGEDMLNLANVLDSSVKKFSI